MGYQLYKNATNVCKIGEQVTNDSNEPAINTDSLVT